MHIRTAKECDRDDVRGVNLSAFPDDERDVVSKLAVNLLSEETTPPILSLVAEADGAVVGHVAFSPVTIGANTDLSGYILAPLAVSPAFQKRGIGSQLVKAGMQQLSTMGVGILFVYGDPAYYCRFGFRVAAAERYPPPNRVRYPAGWQAVSLNGNAMEGPPVALACVSSLCNPVLW